MTKPKKRPYKGLIETHIRYNNAPRRDRTKCGERLIRRGLFFNSHVSVNTGHMGKEKRVYETDDGSRPHAT